MFSLGRKGKVFLAILFFFLILASNVRALAVLSLDKVDYVTYDSVVKEPAWLLWVALAGYGESIVGQTFTAEEIQEKNPGGERPLYDLRIDMSVNEQYCEYPIRVRDDWVHFLDYEIRNLPLGIGAGEFEQECYDRLGDSVVTVWFGKLPGSWDYYCIWKFQYARIGDILTPSLKFTATVQLTRDGDTRTALIGSSELVQKSVWIEDVAYVAWTGNLVSGEQCPLASDYKIGAVFEGGNWKTVDSVKLTTYLSFDAGFDLEACINAYNNVQYCVNEYNSRAYDALVPKSFSYYEGGQYLGTAVPVEGENKLVMNLPKALQYPTFLMRIKASWLGVQLRCGYPYIERIYTPYVEVTSGTESYIRGRLKNVGDQPGWFSAVVECEDPRVYVPGIMPDWNVQPGQSVEFSIPLSADVGSTVTTTCSVYFYDKTCPDRTSQTATISVKAKPPEVCSPIGARQCLGRAIIECTEEGWVPVRYCEYDCEYVNGIPTCVTPADRDGDGIPDDIDKCPDQPGPLENEGCPYVEVCEWWDIPCHLRNFTRWLMRALENFLIFVGLVSVAVVSIWVTIKILRRK